MVVQQQRPALGNRLEHEIVDAYDAWLIAVKDGPGDQPIDDTLDLDRHAAGEVGRPRDLRFDHLDAELLSEMRRIHEVHPLAHRAEDALQDRDRDRRDLEFGDLAGIFDLDDVDSPLGQLALEGAELFGEHQIGPDLVHLLR